MRIAVSLLILYAFAFSTGCQAEALEADKSFEHTPSPVVEAASTSVPVISTQGEPQLTPSLPIPTDAGLQNLIERTKEDLASRLSVSIDAIEVSEVTEVEWSDSSLDCPQPGMEYLQVITPGYRILLGSSGNVYEYHSNRDAYFVYCENRVPPIIPKS